MDVDVGALRRMKLNYAIFRRPEQRLDETHLGPVWDAPPDRNTAVLPTLTYFILAIRSEDMQTLSAWPLNIKYAIGCARRRTELAGKDTILLYLAIELHRSAT